MITTYDPFGKNRMVYTIRNKCEEMTDMEYDDGARTIYLYTKGEPGEASQKLVELMRYMQKTTEENACSEELKEIHEMIKIVKQDKGVKLEYMKQFERDEMLREEGREEERMKQFERDEMLREEGREEERKKNEKLLEAALARAQAAEAELEKLRTGNIA